MVQSMNYHDATYHVLRLAFELTYLFRGEVHIKQWASLWSEQCGLTEKSE